jgi:opacity protein-like surface antigen
MNKLQPTIIALAIGACGLLTTNSFAQESTSHFAFDVQGGFTSNPGTTARNVNTGWNLGAGVGYNFNTHIGALLDFGYNESGINQNTLSNLGYPGGDVRIWDVSLDPIYHFTPAGPVDFYVTGGGGIYHFNQEFTTPPGATVTGYNSFFGFTQPGIPTSSVPNFYTVNRPGFDIGAGLAFGTKWHAKIFAEAKWERVIFGDGHYDMIPVSVGVRY